MLPNKRGGGAARAGGQPNGSDPARLARSAVEQGAQVVVAVGGDGHAAAVATGLLGTDAALGLLPAGTGFDAVVAATAERIPLARGTARYVLALLRELPRFRAGTFRLTVDGERHAMRAMMVAVANGPAYGGGMRVAPAATLQSGWLEICIVGELSAIDFLRAFPRVYRGTHVDHPRVTMLRGRQIEIDAQPAFAVIGDGEHLGSLPARFTLLPSALSVVVAADTPVR